MSTFWQDLRYGIRMLLKQPGFTIVAVITLALGVGANTAIFSVTDKLLIKSLPVQHPEQLVLITSVSVNPYFVSNAFSYPELNDYRSDQQVLSGLIGFHRTQLQWNTGDRIERVSSEIVSGNYFDVLGIHAARGRMFLPEEDRAPGTQPFVVVSEAFRQRYLGDQDPIGKKLTLNDQSLTVIGVAPRDFDGMTLERPTDVWVPILMHPLLTQSKFIENRKDRFLQLIGRVKEGVPIAQAETEFDLVAQRIKEANTPAGTITKGLPFSEQHMKFEPGGKGISILRKRFASPLKLLMVVVALVLLIACANVAGLLLARGLARRKEMAIRLSLGANSWRLTRQLLTESLLLAVAGGAAGLLIAPWLVTLIVKSQSRLDIARTLLRQGIDRRVLAFTVLTTVIAGIVFGVLPAWQSSKAQLVPALKEEGRASSQRQHRFNFRSLLVVGQLAIAIVVLIAAGLCIRSFRNLLAIDPGYKAENLLVVPFELDDKKYDEARGAVFQRQVFERLAAMPGVEASSYGLVMPFSGSRFMSSIFVEGRPPEPNEQNAFDASVIGPRYYETMGIKMVAGRGFTDQDSRGAPKVVVINEALARRLFPGEDALGKKLTMSTNGPGLEIIGITQDIKHHDLTEAPLPHFDLPALQREYDSYTNIVLRTQNDPADLIGAVRSQLLSMDPALSVSGITPMSLQIRNALAATSLASSLVAVFGLLALLLASIGLYGVMAWLVSQRTREVGIRMALGAQPRDVLRLVLRQGLILTGAGLLIGLAAALVATRLFDTQVLYGVSPRDAFTFAAGSLVLTGVSLLACYIPARRATKVDPLVALRYE
ncbi:MAG TPA: ABC transporter permease [Pyrinomonadaceae bacterium]|nr:ABC transporter permease [Pyrinomonadaceae bacterium]